MAVSIIAARLPPATHLSITEKPRRLYHRRSRHHMTITLELPPEIEALIVAEARNKGIPVADVIKAHLILDHAPVSESVRLSPEQRSEALDDVFDSIKVPSGVQEGAFHRENWYR
jgi:hypothetical protein